MTNEKLSMLYVGTVHVARNRNSSGDESPVPGDYRTRCPEGGNGLMFGMLEGCGGYAGSVFVIVDPF